MASAAVVTMPEPALAVEDDPRAIDEVDAAFADDGTSSYSASLRTSIYNHRYENGRRYHAFRDGSYLNPDDEAEQDRLDLLHHIWRMMMNGSLYTAPLSSDVKTILDVGTGTGIWAVEMAEEFPGAEISGVDISPIQPSWVPSNCSFHIDDLESEWAFQTPFDYVHGRALGGAVSDWPRFHSEAFKNLKPGAWFEMQEFNGFLGSDDGTLKKDSACVKWTDEMDRASVMFGKKYDVASRQAEWMKAAGFVNIKEEIRKVPVGPWAKDKKMKEMGKILEFQMKQSVDSYTPAPYTRLLGYSMEETQKAMDEVKAEMSDRAIHMYCTYHFVIGQKPEQSPPSQ